MRPIDLDDRRTVHLLCNLEPKWKPMSEFNPETGMFEELSSIVEEFHKLPVLDVVPAKRGHWSPPGENGERGCSVCGYLTFPYMFGKQIFNFCPYCGAEMVGHDG